VTDLDLADRIRSVLDTEDRQPVEVLLDDLAAIAARLRDLGRVRTATLVESARQVAVFEARDRGMIP
jgi:hypothetical protein